VGGQKNLPSIHYFHFFFYYLFFFPVLAPRAAGSSERKSQGLLSECGNGRVHRNTEEGTLAQHISRHLSIRNPKL